MFPLTLAQASAASVLDSPGFVFHGLMFLGQSLFTFFMIPISAKFLGGATQRVNVKTSATWAMAIGLLTALPQIGPFLGFFATGFVATRYYQIGFAQSVAFIGACFIFPFICAFGMTAYTLLVTSGIQSGKRADVGYHEMGGSEASGEDGEGAEDDEGYEDDDGY